MLNRMVGERGIGDPAGSCSQSTESWGDEGTSPFKHAVAWDQRFRVRPVWGLSV